MPSHHPAPRAVACDVAAHAWVRVPMEAVPELRRKPGPWCEPPLPLNALKQADEQTVAAVSAVHHALHRHGLDAAAFRDWGVLAAPYYMGRPAMAAAVQRYQTEGAWGASPHLPAHRSLHSPSGTISQLFKFRGPNIGVCGGPGCATEVLAAAAALLARNRVPGVWVVLTAFDPDVPPNRAGALAAGTHCAALALALTPPRAAATSGVRLRVAAGGPAPVPPPTGEAVLSLDLFGLRAVLDALTQAPEAGRVAFVLPMEAGGRLEVEKIVRPVHAHRNADGAALDARLLSPLPLAEAQR